MTDIYSLDGLGETDFQYQALIRMPVFKLFMQLADKNLSLPRLTSTERWVLASIIFCNHRGWPTSRKLLSRISMASLAGVTKALRTLVSHTIVTKNTRRDVNNSHLPTEYTPAADLLSLNGDSDVVFEGRR